MSDTLPPDDAPEMTAAELALGLLEGEARAAALRRLLADRVFAAEVDRWRDRFALLHLAAPEAIPSADLFERIQASLDARRTVVQDTTVRRGWLWPALAAAAGIAALFLLALRLVPPAVPPVTPPPVAPTIAPASAPLLVAALVGDRGGAPVTAVYEPSRRALRVAPAALAGATQSQQLWAIGGDGVPHSLGLLGHDATTVSITAADRPRLAVGATLAISIEPVGGSPTGLPTGPVVAKGALLRV